MVMTTGTVMVIVAVVLGLLLLSVLFTFVPVMLWISALAAGVRVSIFTLVGMRLRRRIRQVFLLQQTSWKATILQAVTWTGS